LEAVKNCGRKLLGGQWILFVKVSNLAFSMSKICCRFPRVRAFFIAFPFNSVLELSTEDMEVCDLVDFVLLFIFYHDRIRQQRLVKTVVLVGSKTVDIKHRIEL
jgi:hypothetical protein